MNRNFVVVLDVIIKTGYTHKTNNEIVGLKKVSIDAKGNSL